MPNLGWWQEDRADLYQDACSELLPLTTLLVGNHSTLSRWLLPDWEQERALRTGHRHGGQRAGRALYPRSPALPCPTNTSKTHWPRPHCHLQQQDRSALKRSSPVRVTPVGGTGRPEVASGTELSESVNEALNHLDNCLEGGFPARHGPCAAGPPVLGP